MQGWKKSISAQDRQLPKNHDGLAAPVEVDVKGRGV